MRLALPLIVCALATACSAPPEESAGEKDQAALEKMLRELDESILRAYVVDNDIEPLRAATREEYFVIAPIGFETREQVFSGNSNLDVESAEVEYKRVRILGSTALVGGTLTAKGTLRGRPIPVLNFLSVYVKEDGKWWLEARTLSPEPSPQGTEGS